MVPRLRKVAMARRRPLAWSGVNCGRDDGQLHRLFLEQGHALRLVQHFFQFVRTCGSAGPG